MKINKNLISNLPKIIALIALAFFFIVQNFNDSNSMNWLFFGVVFLAVFVCAPIAIFFLYQSQRNERLKRKQKFTNQINQLKGNKI